MMKAASLLLAFALVVGVASTADAYYQVWWTASGGPVVSQGASDGSTDLVLDGSGGAATWHIEMYLAMDAATSSGWSASILGDTDTLSSSVPTYGDWGPVFFSGTPTAPGAGGILNDGQSQGNFGGTGGTAMLVEWDLSYDGIGALDQVLIYAPTSSGWGSSDPGGFPTVAFGTSAPTVMSGGESFPGVITIVPEPATLALLGFGVLALIRRR